MYILQRFITAHAREARPLKLSFWQRLCVWDLFFIFNHYLLLHTHSRLHSVDPLSFGHDLIT